MSNSVFWFIISQSSKTMKNGEAQLEVNAMEH